MLPIVCDAEEIFAKFRVKMWAIVREVRFDFAKRGGSAVFDCC